MSAQARLERWMFVDPERRSVVFRSHALYSGEVGWEVSVDIEVLEEGRQSEVVVNIQPHSSLEAAAAYAITRLSEAGVYVP